MQIYFNLVGAGLGPNGGSHTIVKSANILVDQGHDVSIVDSGKNQHNWTPLKANHIVPKNVASLPKADVVIATGFKTVPSTLKTPAKLKVHWLRAWELWQMSEDQIVKKVLRVPTVKIVNGLGLYSKLRSYNVESYIIRPGNDLEDFFPIEIPFEGKIVLGGLYHTRHKTKRTDWIFKAVKTLRETFKNKKNIQLWMFGTGSSPPYPTVDRYFQLPDIKTKNMFYNRVTIWLAPSSLEGLHIVPQEVMLTECPVVTTEAPLSGTQDYIQDMRTGLVSMNDLEHFTTKIESLIQFPDLRTFLGKRGRKKIIELGDRKTNMREMTSLFEDLL